jgi:c-di-GMP-binding flagellar brake protein YcgR
MSKEKRKGPRIDLFVQVRIKHQGLHKVKDLSLSGLFIQTPNSSQFETGDEVEVVMQLPGEEKPIYLDARVRRVATDGIGVEFVRVPPKEQAALEYCFDIFKHTVPLPNSW